MKFGCSVIVSNNLAIQEAVGDCGFINPYDENSLIKSIEILLSNKKRRKKLKLKMV